MPSIHLCWIYPHGHIAQRSTIQDSNCYVPLTLVGIQQLLCANSISHSSHWSSVQSFLGMNPSYCQLSIHLQLMRSFQALPVFLVSSRYTIDVCFLTIMLPFSLVRQATNSLWMWTMPLCVLGKSLRSVLGHIAMRQLQNTGFSMIVRAYWNCQQLVTTTTTTLICCTW